MKQGKSKWERLIEMPESYTHTDIAEQVIKEIAMEDKQIRPQNWFIRYWKPIVACAVTCAISFGVGIPIYSLLTPEKIVYYATEEVRYESIDDVSLFVNENDLSICYFVSPNTNTKFAMINETGEIAFLVQDALYIVDRGFDKVNLISVIKKNAEFDFHSKFAILEESIMIGEIIVTYDTIENEGMLQQQILAQFTYQNVKYYMDILTFSEAEESVRTYVSMLIG